MAQPDAGAAAGASAPLSEPNANGHTQHQQQQSIWRRLFSGRDKDNGADGPSEPAFKGQGLEQPGDTKGGIIRRVSRKVVPGLPRAQTFKRQRSEVRSRLEPVRPSTAERRAVSVDRRVQASNSALHHSDPRASAPDFLHHSFSAPSSPPSFPMSPLEGMLAVDSTGDVDGFDLDRDSADGDYMHDADTLSKIDIQSMTTSQYDALIDSELERKWILNLSMHFRDKSKREKFFVTFRQHDHHWRRVTISLDYRNAPENSLEADLARTETQREKSAKIYEAIRESLAEIDFYSTVTNLKLETMDGRLHVHVVEDVNEIISYPPVRMIQHMNCRRVRERELHFDSHMSGFVYKVRVHGRLLIKKEIPGPDTVDEFLYEINALNQLYPAKNVIQFYGIVVDDREENVTGLLISYASRGALIDVIYDNDHSLPWPTREKWARQIVGGLSEIHEAGFVQGDFTLSNIVIDENEDAKIIDINRRGCPIGWEPPEATPLIDSNQRISMYIGVKSDLYQLGMVLWALATQEDEPDAYGRPLKIDADVAVPAWYRRVVDICLSTNPRDRVQAIQLLSWFPDHEDGSQYGRPNGSSLSVNGDGNSRRTYLSPSLIPQIKTVHPPSDWAFVGWGAHHPTDDSFYYPSRGRSPPSPMPSNQGDYGPSRYGHRMHTWSEPFNRAPAVPSVSGVLARGSNGESDPRLRGSDETLETYADGLGRSRGATTETSRDDESFADRGRSLSRSNQYDGKTEPTGAAEMDHRTLTWGPASKHWRLGEEAHISEGGDGSRSGEQGNRGTTRPDSQADSGKDLTEAASTPREHRSPFNISRERSVSRGRRGRSSAGCSRPDTEQQKPTLTAPVTSGLTPNHHPHESDSHDRVSLPEPDGSGPEHEHGHGQQHDRSHHHHPQAPSEHAYTKRPDDILKGIGSAYHPTSDDDAHDDEKRQHEMVIDDEEGLDSELDTRLRVALAAASKEKQ